MKKYLNKKYMIIGITTLIIIISIIIFIYINKSDNVVNAEVYEDNEILESKDIVETTKEEKEETIVLPKCYVKVDIKGYVNKPGLYQLECDNRVVDVINKAGGLKKNADTSVINLSKKIFDQMVIIIYSKDEVKEFTKVKEEEKVKEEKCINTEIVKNDACISDIVDNTKKDENIKEEKNTNEQVIGSKKVSLNNASLEELMTLTGIGESKALNIIDYREKNNGFKNIEEIMNISGIGEKAYEKIKDNLTL